MRILPLLVATFAAAAHAAEPWTGPPVLVTAGTGEIRVAPDRAVVHLAAETRAKTAREAQAAEAQATAAVRKSLDELRIPEGSVRTLAYDLQQEFDYVQGRQTPRGFVARHVLEVRVDDLSRLGELIGKAVDAGSASVSGIRFDVKARDELEREALRKAVEDARKRADAAAQGAGMRLGGVIRLEEQRQLDGPRPVPFAREMAAQAAAVATPVAAGEIEIRSTVTLTSALQ